MLLALANAQALVALAVAENSHGQSAPLSFGHVEGRTQLLSTNCDDARCPLLSHGDKGAEFCSYSKN